MRLTIVHSIVLIVQLLVVSATTHSLPKTEFSPFGSEDFCSQIITTTCNTTFSYIDDLNKEIRPYIESLVRTSYFRYFKIDLDKQCKFWNAQHFCATQNCAVEVLEDFNWTQVTNENLKPSKLGEIKLPDVTAIENPIETEEVETCEDLDYCHIDDNHECVYVNLLNNPERFTGYGGNQSFDVWKAIYSENCFPNTNPMSMNFNGEQAQEQEQCTEKNLFYRLVSGMHASIAVHLSNEYLCSRTGEFYPNLSVFMERVGKFNDRLSNIYFNYALVAQSLVKLSEILPLKEFIRSGYDDISPAQKQHLVSNNDTDVNEVYDTLLFDDIIPSIASNIVFNTSTLFDPSVDPNLKNEFRARFKNISAIMDCVGCDRCRMWGKIQTIGYGTALKILFESEDPVNAHKLKFRRIEIVALVNTLDRLSKSIQSINNFKKMYLQHLNDVAQGIAQPGDYDSIQNIKTGFAFPFVSGQFPTQQSTPQSSPINSSPAAEKTEKEVPKAKSFKEELEEIAQMEPSERTFSQEFKLVWGEIWGAIKFIFSSYQRFPALLSKLTLIEVNTWWEKLLGRPAVYEYNSPIDIPS